MIPQIFERLKGSSKAGTGLLVLAMLLVGKYVLHFDQELLTQIFWLGVTVIGGTALEDAAHKFGLPSPTGDRGVIPPKPPSA